MVCQCFSVGLSVKITLFVLISAAESQRQNSSMVVMGAIVGGGVMLLIVGVILLVHKRLEDISLVSLFPFYSLLYLFSNHRAGFPNFALVASPTLFTFQL